MPERNPNCPKCNTKMELGFIPDGIYGGVAVPAWVADAPTKNWLGVIATRGKTRYVISTYRCPRCGYLESYAAG